MTVVPAAVLALPPGAPNRSPTEAELAEKLATCGAADLVDLDWPGAAILLADQLPGVQR